MAGVEQRKGGRCNKNCRREQVKTSQKETRDERKRTGRKGKDVNRWGEKKWEMEDLSVERTLIWKGYMT